MNNLIPQVYAVDIESNFKLGNNPIYTSLGVVVSSLLKNAFVLAGVVFFVFLIFGGIVYILNAGSGDKEGVEKGKNAITMAVIGLAIIFLAYWIVQIIEFITGQPILKGSGV